MSEPTHIKALRETVDRLHKVKSKHKKSVPVKETFRGKTVWDGVVEVFDIKGHPRASKAYAWAHDTDDPLKPKRHVTVLHIPPITSPETAVRAVIVSEYRTDGKATEN